MNNSEVTIKLLNVTGNVVIAIAVEKFYEFGLENSACLVDVEHEHEGVESCGCHYNLQLPVLERHVIVLLRNRHPQKNAKFGICKFSTAINLFKSINETFIISIDCLPRVNLKSTKNNPCRVSVITRRYIDESLVKTSLALAM